MRNYLFAAVFSLFLFLALIGVISMSPLAENGIFERTFDKLVGTKPIRQAQSAAAPTADDHPAAPLLTAAPPPTAAPTPPTTRPTTGTPAPTLPAKSPAVSSALTARKTALLNSAATHLQNAALSSKPQVLGAQTTTKQPDAASLYGLINGLRRDQHLPALATDPQLENLAQVLVGKLATSPTVSPADLKAALTAFGYVNMTPLVITAQNTSTSWAALKRWQGSAADAARLLSRQVTAMGAAVSCTTSTTGCTVLLVLAP